MLNPEVLKCHEDLITLERDIQQRKIDNKFFFPGVMLGPYIKSRGIMGTEMSANAAIITMETYV